MDGDLTTLREDLPDRRFAYVVVAEWGSNRCRFHLTPNRAGVFREIFIDPDDAPADPDLLAWLHHDAVFVSNVLRRGVRAAEALAWLDLTLHRGDSPLSLALHAAAMLEEEHGAEIRAAYAALAQTEPEPACPTI